MIDPETLDWDKMDGLLPAIVQDVDDRSVRMVGYVNRDALERTLELGDVTFFSRSKQRLWTKGETSGNRLRLVDARADCDRDAVLFLVRAEGPTCHTGSHSCFGDSLEPPFPAWLGKVVRERATTDESSSYTARLLAEGPKRVAQKVGEEGVETALAGAAGSKTELVSEAADLVYHLTVLLQSRGLGWADVETVLRSRRTSAA